MKDAVRNKEVDFIALKYAGLPEHQGHGPAGAGICGRQGKELGGDQLVIVVRHDQGY